MSGLIIRGGRVIDPASGFDGAADLRLRDGVIREIGTALTASGESEFDARGMIVAPGFVDLHTHLREPGFEQKGTIATETAAALAGGFTTVCAMPNTSPAPDAEQTLAALVERIAQTAVCRVLPIGAITRGRAGKALAELTELVSGGCVALSDDGSPVADARLMRHAMEFARTLGVPISEHCDDPSLSQNGAMNEGAVSERLGLSGQPVAAEVSAIARNIALAEVTSCHLHIAHVTSARGVELVADAKARGVRITAEVTPSHLFLTEWAVFGDGAAPLYETNAKVNPPLRTEADRRALLGAVNAGVIDAIATDHAPHAREDKLCEYDEAAFGISCIESAAGQVLTLVGRGELDLGRAIAALTWGPARIWSLDARVPGIGRLDPGTSGDIVVLDPGHTWTVNPGLWRSKGKNTPLTGATLTGAVVATIFKGELLFSREMAHG